MSGKPNPKKVDLEHMILRLPEHIADSLNKDLLDGVDLKKKFSIQFNKESRNCSIRYNNESMGGLILNLPNEACTMKTTDNETFTNLLPVKHMILVEETPKTKYNKDFVLRDGINPPLKNINSLKYRKPKKKQSVQMMKIIKEMLYADSKADSVWYKMVDESDDEETVLRDIEYIRSETSRLEMEKRKAKEAKDQMNAILDESEESDDESSDKSSDSSSDDSDLSLTEDECEDDLSSNDDDFEDY